MRVLLFGATGNVGRAIAKTLATRNISFCAVVRSLKKAVALGLPAENCIEVDLLDGSNHQHICRGFDTVVSALGKSVSLNDKSKAGFKDVDLHANTLILNSAIANNVGKFVYISAFGAEHFQHLTYFYVHHEFSCRLVKSGLDYTVMKPTGLFSAFTDLIPVARKGRIVNIGDGHFRTNLLSEWDLATITVDHLGPGRMIVDAGGGHVYSRSEIMQIVQNAVLSRKVPTIPMFVFKSALPIVRLIDRNTYDKLAFFLAVINKDTIAPMLGKERFETYMLQAVAKNELGQ